ncbi:MAG: hypothetical protein HZB50_04605 [Chloroflexi bacterium]|nr:hypothetical protein [Chloroflexota bacterium]
MARFYYLLTAFENQIHAEKCASFFHGKNFSLTSGMIFHCDSWVSSSDGNKLFWVTTEPEGVSLKSQPKHWLQNSEQLDEIAALLYQSLTHMELFSCAIVGWEVADLFLPDVTCGRSDMRIDPSSFGVPGWSGLVIAKSLVSSVENKQVFQPFCEGYVWQPYRTLSISGW